MFVFMPKQVNKIMPIFCIRVEPQDMSLHLRCFLWAVDQYHFVLPCYIWPCYQFSSVALLSSALNSFYVKKYYRLSVLWIYARASTHEREKSVFFEHWMGQKNRSAHYIVMAHLHFSWSERRYHSRIIIHPNSRSLKM